MRSDIGALELADIVDRTDFMHFDQSWTDYRLRYCPRKKNYPAGTTATENQWDRFHAHEAVVMKGLATLLVLLSVLVAQGASNYSTQRTAMSTSAQDYIDAFRRGEDFVAPSKGVFVDGQPDDAALEVLGRELGAGNPMYAKTSSSCWWTSDAAPTRSRPGARIHCAISASLHCWPALDWTGRMPVARQPWRLCANWFSSAT